MNPIPSADVGIQSASLGGNLTQLLMADDLQPGSDPSYQLCKVIYLYHPLGAKMTETPIKIAQSQKRRRTVQDAPQEVMEEFEKEWARMKADAYISYVMTVARIYGIASVALLEDNEISDQPLDPTQLWKKSLAFNVLDPLNTAGSLVLNQIPTNATFMKPVTVRVNGKSVHPTRFEVVMNEMPVYIAYTNSAFGFVGRSVYQRALFPLKSYIRTMLANDMIATKLGLLVFKMKKPGSTIDQVMETIGGIRRFLLKIAQTYQVLSIDPEEDVTTLNMQNVEAAGKFARDNIIKDIATAADMPAKLLDNETFVAGFGEGQEDAKNVARYIEWVRNQAEPVYAYFERVCMYRAWNPESFKRIQRLNPEKLGSQSFEECFSEWKQNYFAEWPSLLIEPESENVKVEQIKNESIVAVAQTLLPELDPDNKKIVLKWVADNISENKRLIAHDLNLDEDLLADFLAEQQEMQEANAQAMGEDKEEKGVANKMGKFA